MFVSLNDPVDVLTAFVEGRMEPLRFRWRGRVIRVKTITGRWNRREGRTVLNYFAVEGSESETFELYYDPRSTRWILARAWTGAA